MAPAPRYDRASAPVAMRLPEEVRRLVDYVVSTEGIPSVSDYLRALVLADLQRRGFDVKEVTAGGRLRC